MNKFQILVVEDDPPVRNLITTTLKAHDYRFTVAANGKTAVMEAASHNPDVILLDLGLPDMDGVEVIRRIRNWSHVPVIVISARSEDSDKIDALDAGADDYLTKPFDLRELAARLRALARRPAALEPTARLRAGGVTLYPEEMRLEGPAGVVKLSKKECELLEMLLRSPGRLLAREQLLARVWGAEAEVDDASLDSYIYLVRRKLARAGAGPRLRLATVRGAGYRLEADGCAPRG